MNDPGVSCGVTEHEASPFALLVCVQLAEPIVRVIVFALIGAELSLRVSLAERRVVSW